jgi:hypothetical protein
MFSPSLRCCRMLSDPNLIMLNPESTNLLSMYLSRLMHLAWHSYVFS